MVFLYIVLFILAVIAAEITVAGNIINIKQRTVYSGKLPMAFNGYRILLMSDMHDRHFRFLKMRLRLMIKDSRPDIILMAGDMHNRGCKRTDFIKFAAYASSVCPVYMVLGNHDPDPGHKDFESYMLSLMQAGVNIATDKTIFLHRDGMHICLTGLSWEQNETGLEFDTSLYNILLTHDPCVFDSEYDIADLTLAGHIHGGFIDLPFIGAVFSPGIGAHIINRLSPSLLFPKYYKNIYVKDGKLLLVSRGLGFSGLPFRFIPAEMDMIVLRQEKN